MFSQLKQRCLLLLVFAIAGLSISLSANSYSIHPVLATAKPVSEVVTVKSAIELEMQGKHFYSIEQFEPAIIYWQQAANIYRQEQDSLSQARILSSLALAQGKLNNWQQAIANITTSLDLIEQNSQITPGERVRALAQILNNQGILQLNQGQAEQAIATWTQAKINYEEMGDELGVIRASINQASAYKQLGLYRRAVKTLQETEKSLIKQPDSLIKVTGLRNYGDILRLVGQVERSQQVLQQSLTIASRLDAPNEEIKTLLALGKIYQSESPNQALKFYRQGLKICQNKSNCLETDFPLQIYLGELNLLLERDSAPKQQIQSLVAQIKPEFTHIPNNRANLDLKINFAHNLIKLKHNSAVTSVTPSEIEQLLQNTIQQAKAINYRQVQSYGWGLRGQLQEQVQQWQTAEKYTQQALALAQNLNAPEIIYLWQWQLGRINRAQGERTQAIAHYTRAVAILKSLSQDLVAIDPDVQYSFRDSVEPVYRELVSLLLETEGQTEVSQVNLEEAREVIESLQLAELNNFFREACLDAQVVDIDRVDRQAAVIYPIILSDRLELILSLPNQPLKHYVTKIGQPKLEAIIEQFRRSIVVRSRRHFYHPASQLYDLLIRPALQDLAANQIATLVFVPDGSLRNIPLGALYDGQKYLIEDYSLALTPGLQLLEPNPLGKVKLKALAAGLTKSRQGFSALEYVDSELADIQNRTKSVVLLDQDFTTQALEQEIKFSDYPIVHIATHGQFSSSIEDTFLVTWNDRININQLDHILQTRNPSQENAIELLVLSACETASGDKWAALGLAGMAVRAGARSTLATLWSVNDRSTSQLMSKFYQELSAQKLPKAEAVRQAQLSLLHSRWYKHPFYWAPYVLLGNWL